MPLEIVRRARSVAVVGASRDPSKPGHIILRNFLRSFRGRIYPVNPSARDILGMRCYKSLLDIPYPVDMAIIVVPGRAVPKVVGEAVTKGVKISIIISQLSGGELDSLIQVLSGSEMRIVGPGSIGIYAPSRGLNTLFLDPLRQGYPRRGSIAVVSQSGAVGTQILDILAELGLGVSIFMGLGKEIDVGVAEVLAELYGDPETEVVALYIEGVLDGREFYKVLRSVSSEKPVLVTVGGDKDLGRIVASHTGQLAGGEILRAAVKQAGGILLEDVDMVGEAALHVLKQPLPRGLRLGIVTGAGGFGISLLNRARAMDMEITAYIDVGGTAGDEAYLRSIEELYRREDVDALVVIPYYPSPSLSNELGREVSALMRDMWGRGYVKPLTILTYPYGYSFRASLQLPSIGIPVSYSPSSYLHVLRSLYSYRRFLERTGLIKRWVERRGYLE